MSWNLLDKIKLFLPKAERDIRNANLDKAAEHLAKIINPNSSKDVVQSEAVKLNEYVGKLSGKDQVALLKKIPSDALLDSKNGKDFALPENKSPRDIVLHFFGMDENWNLKRNLLGGFWVHSPEYPTYFIPAFTQAKATGDASELKKGEGPRGILTGMLEGVAIGALVSGKKMKIREMVPYMFLGAALQLFSSKVFPWLGEKTGRFVYFTRRNKIFKSFTNTEDIEQFHTKSKQKNLEFQGITPYKKKEQGNLKTPAFSGQLKPFSSNMKI